MAILCPSCGAKNIEGVDQCANCGGDLRSIDLPKPASRIEQTVMHQPLTALGMSQIHAISPETTLETAVFTLMRQKADILEVVENNKLVGVLSVRDIVMRVGVNYAQKLSMPVRSFMTPNPETLPPDAPITFAINKMDVGGYRHVPVVQAERMVGVVSSKNVIQYLVDHSRATVATVGKTISHGASA
ncbi:MAG TPA: CBS domain-containing protein [Tepidisphaeraceae bacterium]|jgi:CBS domain-containing protein